MARNYPKFRDWSDGVMPLVTDLLRDLGIETTIAPAEEDIHHCADLLTDTGRRIAVRVRRFRNERYRDRLTVRCQVVSGRRTELDKIVEDPPRLYLLGVTDLHEEALVAWRLVDGRRLAEVLRRGDLVRLDNDDGTAMVEVDLAAHPELVVRSFDDVGLTSRGRRLVEERQRKYLATRLGQLRRPT